eukprot:TRINITY_DN16702_c0_g1_i2.p1 TRINITY_DN16702_c0_g1~~TRINITY_DN16702_c0_g1_i2.p1  ORF type:complete len:572 (-),score=74.08 TRINITY_DN16702_c0_g1_i2:57-1772(-)
MEMPRELHHHHRHDHHHDLHPHPELHHESAKGIPRGRRSLLQHASSDDRNYHHRLAGLDKIPDRHEFTLTRSNSNPSESHSQGSKAVEEAASASHILQKIERAILGARRSAIGNGNAHIEMPNPLKMTIDNILSSKYTKGFMSACAILNLAVIVVEADLQARSEDVHWAKLSGLAFLVIFFVECVAKVYVYGTTFVQDTMNNVDAVVLVVDIIGSTMEASIGGLPSFTVLRSLRFLRVARVLKEIVIFRELYLMIAGLVSAVRAIFFGSVLIMLTLLMFSILAVQVLHPMAGDMLDKDHGECERCLEAFRSVSRSMLTFLQLTVVADSWDLYARPLLEHRPESALVLIPAYICVQLGLVNVIAAVIVDRQSAAREADAVLQHLHHCEALDSSFTRLSAVFERLDADKSGELGAEEIVHAFETDAEFRQMLQVLDIDRDDMATVFEILDPDESGCVSYSEFISKLHYIRLINPHTLLVFIRHYSESLIRKVKEMTTKNDDILHWVADAPARSYSGTSYLCSPLMAQACQTRRHWGTDVYCGSMATPGSHAPHDSPKADPHVIMVYLCFRSRG